MVRPGNGTIVNLKNYPGFNILYIACLKGDVYLLNMLMHNWE